jgi:outer membrane protein insertion porin family
LLPIFPQTVESVELTGNSNFSKETYLQWADINMGIKLYKGLADSIGSRIKNNLSGNGYLYSSVDKVGLLFSEDSSKVKIIINVIENKPVYVNQIFFEGIDSVEQQKFYNDLDFFIGGIFIQNKLEESITSMLNYYEENGYPFSKILISSVHFYYDSLDSKNLADIYLKIEKQNLSRFDKIEVKGNTSTKDYVILRELDIRPGEDFSQKKIDKIPIELNRLRFFEPIKEPEFYFNSKDEGILQIDVKEIETNNFDGIIGYMPGNGKGQQGYFTGLVDVSFRNLFGTGRAAAVHWQKIDPYSQELELKYLEPWVFDYPFNIQIGLFERQQDTSYVDRSVNADIEYLATDEISFSLLLSSEQVVPTVGNYTVFTVYNSSLLSTGINFKIDTRDDPYAPTKGIFFNNSYTYIRKKINGPVQYYTPGMQTSVNLQKFTADFNFFYQLFKRQVIALGLHGKLLKGPLLEASDLFRLGGANTLRGYVEDQFLGSIVAWSNLEYRLLLTQRSYAFLFFDTGYYQRDADAQLGIDRNSAFKIGYGLGLSLETKLGLLSVSFAMAKGDSFSEGKIHFGIVSEF